LSELLNIPLEQIAAPQPSGDSDVCWYFTVQVGGDTKDVRIDDLCFERHSPDDVRRHLADVGATSLIEPGCQSLKLVSKMTVGGPMLSMTRA
jgi:hypothetical protein